LPPRTTALDTKVAEKTPVIFFEILLFGVAFFLALFVIIPISNLFYLRSLSSYKMAGGTPFVSILVPARNEEDVIGDCVKSLLAQDYPNFEVIVMDDDSTDSTLQILLGMASADSRLKIERGTALPPGWLGKHWACHQLSQKARGELILFTDADTVHKPQMLRQAVSAMAEEKADLISAEPKQVMLTFAEKLVMPYTYLSIMSYLPLAVAYNSRFSVLSSATGQFMLFRRSAYDQIGGFESIKHHVVDDVELCKKIRMQGLRWRLLDGKDGYQVRQYTNFAEIYEGHTKNLFAGFGNNVAGYCLAWLWLLTMYWLPLAGLAVSLLMPGLSLVFWVSLSCIILSLLSWAIAYIRFALPVYLISIYPVIVLLMAYMAAGSMFLNLSKKATWKGRYMPGNI
jgi:chlorobactene glucosyltransferase